MVHGLDDKIRSNVSWYADRYKYVLHANYQQVLSICDFHLSSTCCGLTCCLDLQAVSCRTWWVGLVTLGKPVEGNQLGKV